MGILDGIKDGIKGIGNSVGVVYNLCNKSWLQIDDSCDRITYVFKSNNQLYYTTNGVSQIVPWKYFPENERLVIYFKNNVGSSFRYSFIEKGVLLSLKDEQSGKILVLANEGASNAPKSVDDLGQFLMKRNATIVGSAIGDNVFSRIRNEAYNMGIAATLDNVLKGCNRDMLIEHVNYFKKNVFGFSFYYTNYINYKKYQQDMAELIGDFYLPPLESYLYNIRKYIYPMSRSLYLDDYISFVGDKITYDGRLQPIVDAEKANEEFKEKWGSH